MLTQAARERIIRRVMSFSSFTAAAASPALRAGRLLLIALAALALLTLGRLPLVDEDEGEYSEVAAEMARSSDALAPALNGQPFYEKPALLFWLVAPLLRVAPGSTALARLPSSLASVLCLYLLYAWWRRRAGPNEAQRAAWLAATGLGMAVVGRAATMDALIILALTLTLLCVWEWLETGQARALRWAALAAGLGLLAKGPVALVIPGAVAVAFMLLTPAYGSRWRGLFDPPAWLILLGVGLPWYVWYGIESHGAFLSYFLWRENVGRLGGSLQGHGGGYAYYLGVLPLLFLPHSGALPSVAGRLRVIWATPVERFLLLWFLLVLLIFTLAGTKLPHYLLYGFPPLFLLVARHASFSPRLAAWVGLVLPVVGAALPALAQRLSQQQGNPYLQEMLARGPEVFDLGYTLRAGLWLGLSVLLLLLAYGMRRESAREMRALILPGLLSVIGVSQVLLPAVTGLQQDPVRAAARFAASLHEPVVSDNRMPSFSFYLGQATRMRPVQAGDLAFGRLDHPDRLGRRHEVLFAQGGLRVVRVVEP